MPFTAKGGRVGHKVLVRADVGLPHPEFVEWLQVRRLGYSLGFSLPDDTVRRLALQPGGIQPTTGHRDRPEYRKEDTQQLPATTATQDTNHVKDPGWGTICGFLTKVELLVDFPAEVELFVLAAIEGSGPGRALRVVLENRWSGGVVRRYRAGEPSRLVEGTPLYIL